MKEEYKWRSHDYWFNESYWLANSGGYGVAIEIMQERKVSGMENSEAFDL
jgi:hypothetical protein